MTRSVRTGITLLALAVCSTLVGASGAQGATTTLTGSVAVGGTAFQSKTHHDRDVRQHRRHAGLG